MRLKTWLCAVVVAGLVTPAMAVIKAELTVAKAYGIAGQVVVGKVGKVNAQSRVIEVAEVEALKGEGPAGVMRIQLAQPAELIERVEVGGSVAVIVGKARGEEAPKATVHVADTWLVAEAIATAQTPAWRVVQENAELKKSFPGRSGALVGILRELKEKKPTFLNEVENKVLRGGIKEVAKVEVGEAKLLLAGDVNGDKRVDLVVGGTNGVKVLVGREGGFAEAEWGLSGGTGGAMGDVNGDGKVDLMLGGTIWINQGTKFAAAGKVEMPEDAVGVGVGDANGDGKGDVLAVRRTGELVVWENPGEVGGTWGRKSRALGKEAGEAMSATFGDWGDDGKVQVMVVGSGGVARYAVDAATPAAGFERLTGERGEVLGKVFAEGFKQMRGVGIEVNGNGKRDYLILGAGGAGLLLNRGFGAYFFDGGVDKVVQEPSVAEAAAMAAGDLQGDGHEELVVLGKTGQIWVVDNPKQ